MADHENTRKNARKGLPSKGEGWMVILHNDDVNSMDDVIFAVQDATKIPMEQVIETVQAAHEHGKAYVTVTTQTGAHKIQQCLTKNGIQCSVREC